MKKVIAAVLMVVLMGGLVGWRIMKKAETEVALKARVEHVILPTITTQTAARRVLAPKVVFTGNIRPENEVEIYSKAAGRLVSVNVEVGQRVTAGQVLATVERNIYLLQVKQAEAALAMARAGMMNAQRNSQSAEELAKSDNIADVALVGARAGLASAQASLMQASAAVGLARENLKNTLITSPITGIVTRRSASVGQMVNPGGGGPGSGLFQVQDIASLKLEVAVDEREAPFVKPGMPVVFEVDAWAGTTFEGEVAIVSPSLDPISRRASVEIHVTNKEGKLFANMFARGAITPRKVEEVLAVPSAVLVKGATTPSIFVAEGDTVKLRTIRPGLSDGAYLAVRDGLREGEQVVVSGHNLLKDGMKVIIQGSSPTQMAQPAAQK